MAAESEVTLDARVLDLAAPVDPSPSSWMVVGHRQHGVQQYVSHWQDWFFILRNSPESPNGELRVAPITEPTSSEVSTSTPVRVSLGEMAWRGASGPGPCVAS